MGVGWDGGGGVIITDGLFKVGGWVWVLYHCLGRIKSLTRPGIQASGTGPGLQSRFILVLEGEGWEHALRGLGEPHNKRGLGLTLLLIDPLTERLQDVILKLGR